MMDQLIRYVILHQMSLSEYVSSKLEDVEVGCILVVSIIGLNLVKVSYFLWSFDIAWARAGLAAFGLILLLVS